MSSARPLRHNRSRNPPARPEVALHLGPHRLRPSHHVLQHAVYNVLLKDPQIAVGLQIFLIGFQFEADFVRLVTKRDDAKIRQACLRANRCKLRIVDNNLVSRKLIGPGFDFRELRIQSGGSVLRRVTSLFWHEDIVAFRSAHLQRGAFPIEPRRKGAASTAFRPHLTGYWLGGSMRFRTRAGGKLMLAVIPPIH
jgi:hypothetical protein